MPLVWQPRSQGSRMIKCLNCRSQIKLLPILFSPEISWVICPWKRRSGNKKFLLEILETFSVFSSGVDYYCHARFCFCGWNPKVNPNSSKSYRAVLSCGTVYFAVQGGSNLNLSLRKKSSSVTIQIKATEQYFLLVLFIMLYKVVLTFESVDEIPKLIIQITVPEHHFSVVLFIMYAVRVGSG